MNTINIVKDGIIFENLGKMDLKTASHDLIITFDIKKFISSFEIITNILENSKKMVNDDIHFLHENYAFMIDGILSDLNSSKNKFLRYIQNFNDLSKTKKIKNIISISDKFSFFNNSDITVLDPYMSKLNISENNVQKINNAIDKVNLTFKALNLHINDDKDPLKIFLEKQYWLKA